MTNGPGLGMSKMNDRTDTIQQSSNDAYTCGVLRSLCLLSIMENVYQARVRCWCLGFICFNSLIFPITLGSSCLYFHPILQMRTLMLNVMKRSTQVHMTSKRQL